MICHYEGQKGNDKKKKKSTLLYNFFACSCRYSNYIVSEKRQLQFFFCIVQGGNCQIV